MQKVCENTPDNETIWKTQKQPENNDKLRVDPEDVHVKLECGWNQPRIMSDGWLCICSVEYSGSVIREIYSFYYLLLGFLYVRVG